MQGFNEGNVVLERLNNYIEALGQRMVCGTKDLNATADGVVWQHQSFQGQEDHRRHG